MWRDSTIKFDATTEDAKLIRQIVDRAKNLGDLENIGIVTIDAEMDITAAHLNGNPLDLEKFMAFDNLNFGHDFFGIRRYVSRSTGRLTDHFSPRCSK